MALAYLAEKVKNRFSKHFYRNNREIFTEHSYWKMNF